MKSFNIHITGVGGQGIGLLSQAILRGIDHAGIPAMAVDTHGLAQRGGSVISRIRCGSNIHSPLIMKRQADLVLGMEVHEALRGVDSALKKGGVLAFMDVSWQPLPVRLGQVKPILAKDIQAVCKTAGVRSVMVNVGDLPDARMQNMALLGTVARHGLVPGVLVKNYEAALKDLLTGDMLKNNLSLFTTYAVK